jgi:hypothetical protein
MSVDTLIRALYVGYEIEPSPEEKINNWYQNLTNITSGTYADGVKEGIRGTLDFLNIKLKGVNS